MGNKEESQNICDLKHASWHYSSIWIMIIVISLSSLICHFDIFHAKSEKMGWERHKGFFFIHHKKKIH